jgi:hypothetical protein
MKIFERMDSVDIKNDWKPNVRSSKIGRLIAVTRDSDCNDVPLKVLEKNTKGLMQLIGY